MRETNADRVFDSYFTQQWCYHKNDTLRLATDTNFIYDGNTLIGKIIDIENHYTGDWEQFVILTLQNFRSQPSWLAHKKQLIEAANINGYPVLFVSHLDMGFGEKEVELDDDYLTKNMLKLKLYAGAMRNQYSYALIESVNSNDIVINDIYTCTQLINNKILTSVEILCKYINCVDSNKVSITSLLEPSYDSLKAILNTNVTEIRFSKSVVGEFNQIELMNSFIIKAAFNKEQKPIIIKTIKNKRIDKLFKGE